MPSARILAWPVSSITTNRPALWRAEAYYRLNNRLALVNVTSGPGGTNAITGVYGAYVDSIGMLVVSGQVKRETTVRSYWPPFAPIRGPRTRHRAALSADHEILRDGDRPDIPSATILEKAVLSGDSLGSARPVWLDIPLDVQGAQDRSGVAARLRPGGNRGSIGKRPISPPPSDELWPNSRGAPAGRLRRRRRAAVGPPSGTSCALSKSSAFPSSPAGTPMTRSGTRIRSIAAVRGPSAIAAAISLCKTPTCWWSSAAG